MNKTELIAAVAEKAELSKKDRVIFIRRYWYSLTAAQIGKEMGLTENAVWVRLHRTREKLWVYLKERGYSV